MQKPTPEALLPLFDRVLETEIGIAIATNDPKALRQELLAAKRGQAQYDDIITFIPAGKDEVYLCKKSVELPDV
jgi:hypothetical protein